MGTEIERRFRVDVDRLCPNGEDGKPMPPGVYMVQGYLSREPVVRVRLKSRDARAFSIEALRNRDVSRTDLPDHGLQLATLTIKGKGTLVRPEFNYSIDPYEAAEMLAMATCQIAKTRYRLQVAGRTWEVDKFSGAHFGLWLAEIELERADQDFFRPAWAGTEVTEDPRFSNVRLAANPERFWEGTG